MLRFVFSVLVAVFVASSAAAQPQVIAGPEYAIAEAGISPREWPSQVRFVLPLGDGFVALWTADGDVFATRFDVRGRPLGEPLEIISTGDPASVPSFSAAISPAGKLLVLRSTAGEARLIRFDETLNVETERTLGAGAAGGSSLTCNASRCLILTWTWSDVTASVIDEQGNVIVPVSTVMSESPRGLRVAGTGETFAISADNHSGNAELLIVNNAMQVFNRRMLAKDECAISASGQGYVLACYDRQTIELSSIDERGLELRDPATVVRTELGFGIGQVDIGSSGSSHALVFGVVEGCAVITGGTCDETIYARRFRRDLVAQDGQASAIGALHYTNVLADVAANGPDYLVGWNLHNGFEPPFAHVTALPASPELPGSRHSLRVGPNRQWPGPMATSSTGSLALWTEVTVEGANLLARRIDTNGAPLGPAIVLSEEVPTAPVVASDGREYLVMWIEPGPPYFERGGLFDRVKMVVIDAVTGAVTRLPDFEARAWVPVLEWTGSAYVTLDIVYEQRTLALRFLGPRGEESGRSNIIREDYWNWNNTIASGPDRILLTEDRGNSRQFIVVDASGRLVATPPPMADDWYAPTLTEWVGGEFLMVSGRNRDVILTRISRDGAVVEESVIGVGLPVAIIPRGDGVTILWANDSGTHAATYHPGTRTTSPPFTVLQDEFATAASAVPGGLVVTYTKKDETPVRLYSRRVEITAPARRRATGRLP